ncbi:MAG TPA: TlpA disulfide reductase family protein [Rhodocyclaceae bacterium]|nr:TlpA disulfide reductase family protein [Rhodocyclaceae bacterium]
MNKQANQHRASPRRAALAGRGFDVVERVPLVVGAGGRQSGVAGNFLQARCGMWRRAIVRGLVAWLPAGAVAAQDLPLPPQLGPAGRQDFAAYQVAERHKAFAIAPGGSWAWVAEQASPEAARERALERCSEHTEQTCLLYALDQRRVFDPKRWAGLWRLPAAGATPVASGLGRGAVFPDLAFASAEGQPKRLAEWRGKVVVLHFWGSWCGPCRHELPALAAQAKALSGQGVSFIPLQVREPFAAARRWIEQQGIALTLYDSGIRSGDDGVLRIVGGGTLPDRAVAPVFPSTVVLDRSGRVVFSHHGPIEPWADYAPLLRDLAR